MNENEQLEQLNQLPLSQHAKKLLVAARQVPDPSQLYLFQLAEWRLASPDPQVESPLRLQGYLGNVQRLSPQAQWDRLLAVDPANPEELDRLAHTFLQDEDPREAADSLLQVLNLHASQRVPYWDRT